MDKERKAIIKNSDMTEDMQQDAINVATKAKVLKISFFIYSFFQLLAFILIKVQK